MGETTRVQCLKKRAKRKRCGKKACMEISVLQSMKGDAKKNERKSITEKSGDLVLLAGREDHLPDSERSLSNSD